MNPHLGRATIARATVPVILMFMAGCLAAGMARLFIHADWLTCLLVAAPGGSPEMIWISLSLNHNVEIVTASHLVRLLTLNIALPGLVSLVNYLDSKSAVDQKESGILRQQDVATNPLQIPDNS